MLGVYTILGVADVGWGSARTLGLGAVSIALLAAFVARQSRIETPLMPLRLFRARNITGANLVMAPLVAGMFAMFFLGALYLQQVLGYSPLEVGLAFLPSSALMGVISLRYTERLISHFGARGSLIGGAAFIGAGLLLFARVPVEGTYLADILAPTILIGVGAGICFPSLMQLAMTGAEPQDTGLASGLINSTVQVGGAIGLAVLATLSTGRTEDLTAAGESAASALTGGFRLAFLIGAALVGAALVAAVTVLRSERQRPAVGQALPEAA
jgi:predicted MFS family arabinose efflux permease